MNRNLPTAHLAGENTRARFLLPVWIRWLLALAWMGLIYFFSAQSSFALLDRVWQPDLLSIAAHFTEYAVLAVLLWLAVRNTASLAHLATPIAFVIAVLYAISDELHQWFVPGRYTDIRDVMVDALGVVVALWLVSRRSNREK